eukprot:gene1200-15566_t
MAAKIDAIENIDIDSVSDIAEIKRLYTLLQQKEQELDEELDSILDNRLIVDSKVEAIQNLVPNIEVLTENAKHLEHVISDTNQLAEKVSSKVRILDLAKSRVQDTIKRVDDILDLKSCVEGVETALRKEEFEQAAAFIHRYLNLDERALREILPDNSEGTDLKHSFNFLHDAQGKLQQIVRDKFDAAVSSNYSAAVERFFKLFPLVGIDDEGLTKFSQYLRKQIEAMGEINLDTAIKINPQDRRANVIFADTLTLLFEGIARIVEDHQPLVDTYYGPGRMVTVLKALQEECDIQSQKIVDQFIISRKFKTMFDAVKKSTAATKSTSSSTSQQRLDPRELDILLGEVVLLSARTELYVGFLRRRLRADLNGIQKEEMGEDLTALEARLISNSGLSQKLQTLIGDYIFMEEYFMKEMIFKAVSLDSTEDDTLISSMVDDVFFVMQKSLMRTISTSNMDAICAMVNNASSILLSEYKDVLRVRIKSGYPSSSLDISGMIQGAVKMQTSSQSQDAAKLKRNFLIALNNIEVSINNLKKLRATIENECRRLFDQIGSRGKDKVEAGISQLCNNGVLPKLSSLIEGFSSINHVISEDEFSLYEVNDPFVQNFIANLDKGLSSLKDSLTTSNHENVVNLVCSELATRLEKSVMKSSYNRLGGLQFDKELRALVGYLTNITEWTVRDKFARLTQIATILNLEKVGELLDYWGANSGPMTWRLTPAEVRQVLILRVDFRTEDIQRLRL